MDLLINELRYFRIYMDLMISEMKYSKIYIPFNSLQSYLPNIDLST